MEQLEKLEDVDITISGGGLIGTSLAIALSEISADYKIALIESQDIYNQNQSQINSQSIGDMRSIALSYASKIFFEELDLWHEIKNDCTPIKKIHISEKNRFGKIVLDSQELSLPEFGYVVPAIILYQILNQELMIKIKNKKNIKIISPAKLINFNLENKNWNLNLDYLKNKINFKTRLLIAADGDKSFIRNYLNLDVDQKNYNQTAIVSTADISKDHFYTAYERFSNNGVLAVMPRENINKNNRVGIIWTVDEDKKNKIKNNFLEITQELMGYRLGKFSNLGSIQEHELKFLHVKNQALESGIILLGNAAHILHPVASQGLNLGLRDVRVLVNLLNKYSNIENNNLYFEYNNLRKTDQESSEKFTESLVKLFSIRSKLFSMMRSQGMFLFDLCPYWKQNFCLSKMGMNYL